MYWPLAMSAVAAVIKGDRTEKEKCLTEEGDEHVKNIFVCSKFGNPCSDFHAYSLTGCSAYSSLIITNWKASEAVNCTGFLVGKQI